MKSDCIENGETTHLSREDTLLARGEILGLSASAPSYANGHGQGQGQGSSFQGQKAVYMVIFVRFSERKYKLFL